MTENLEKISEWKIEIKEEAAESIMTSFINTEKRFMPRWSDDTESEGIKVEVEDYKGTKEGYSKVYLVVKGKPGSLYPRRLIGLLEHDIHTRCPDIISMEHKKYRTA